MSPVDGCGLTRQANFAPLGPDREVCGGGGNIIGNPGGLRGTGPEYPDMEDSGSALEKNVADLTVMDVYDIAAVVGQEFERIIDQYGCEALSRLMPKVVRVLEILEVMVSRSSISPETEELRLELDKLRLERMDRLEKEKRHRKVWAGRGGRFRSVPIGPDQFSPVLIGPGRSRSVRLSYTE